MNNDYDMKDMEQRTKLTISKALRNKDKSYKSIRIKYYNWRTDNYKRKINMMKEKMANYNNLRMNVEGNKEYSGWVDYQAERFTNWRYQRKLKKLENQLRYIEYKSNNPSSMYKMFSKGLNKFKRLLAITEEQKEEINGSAGIKNTEKSENKSETPTDFKVNDNVDVENDKQQEQEEKLETPTDFKVNDDVDVENDKQQEQEEELETPTDFKVSDEIDMENDKSIPEEKIELSDDVISREFDKDIESNNKDITNNDKIEQNNTTEKSLLSDNDINVESDLLTNEQSKENNSNIEKDIDKDKIISAEEVSKDLNSNTIVDSHNDYTTNYHSNNIVTFERMPYIGVNYEVKDEQSNRDDEIKQRFEDINTAMHGIEADKYFSKSDADYIDKQIEEIMNSADLDYAQKKEKLQSIIKEQKEKEAEQQKAIEQKRLEKENLEKRNLEAMVTNIRNGISKQNELIDMLAEEDERVSSLEDEFNSSIGTR